MGIIDENEEEVPLNVFNSKMFVKHGCNDSKRGDIALIKTDRPIVQINTDPKIKAICLPVANSFPSNKQLFHTGWGVFEKYGKVKSTVLKMAETELYSRSHCNYYSSFVNLGLDREVSTERDHKLCVQAVNNQACFVSAVIVKMC